MDSGLGGLTVVKEAMKKLPHENMVFLGDEARLPYGEKTAKQVQTFAKQIAKFQIKKGIKILVIACNTATAQALPMLKRELNIPVIGVIEPGSEMAIRTTKNNQVGVIATNGTVKNGAYLRAIKKDDPNINLYSLGCPEFVQMVEHGHYSSNDDQKKVSKDLKPIHKTHIDTLIMGCTHFPIMQNLIQKAVGKHIKLVDPGIAITDVIVDVLSDYNLAVDPNNQPHRVFYTTGDVNNFDRIASDWLKMPIHAQHVNVKELEALTK